MEWVETTGKSIEEAKSRALDQLGVAEEDTDFEILEEPRSGLFGRLKGEARVRARVRPASVRPKLERRDRRRSKEEANGSDARDGRDSRSGRGGERGQPRKGRVEAGQAVAQATDAAVAPDTVLASNQRADQGHRHDARRRERPRREPAPQPEREEAIVSAQEVGEEAKKFLVDLVSAFGLSGSVALAEDGDDLELTVTGQDLGLMVGPRGNTLLAIQDLTRVASQRRLGDHDTRLRVDIGGYRERRREALSRFAVQVAEQVASSGQARALEPMPSADRKVIHDVLTGHAAVVTRSEGDDPNRRVVIAPANA